ncbi:MAG: hypothetical protein IPJ71_03650 [Bdellovibrionales bacterium]|nr:hypothetical protein [Bdellovibrionales bacterium]
MNTSIKSISAIRELLTFLVGNHRAEVLKILKSGNSLVTEASKFGEKEVLAHEKLQLYSSNSERTHKLLSEFGITDLLVEAGIADMRLLKTLPNRTQEQKQKAKQRDPIGRSLTLYHRTHIQAAQSIGLGALWVSDNASVIKGRATKSVHAPQGFYPATQFGSLGYGDYDVKIILSPGAVQGVDFSVVGDWYVILTRQALEDPHNPGRLQIERVTRTSLLENAIRLSKTSLTEFQAQSVLRVLFSILRPLQNRADLAHLVSIFAKELVNRTQLIKMYFEQIGGQVFSMLDLPPDHFMQGLLSDFIDLPYSSSHAYLHSAFLEYNAKQLSARGVSIYSKLTDHLWKSSNGKIWFASHPESFRILLRKNRPLAEHIASLHWTTIDFDLQNPDERQLLMNAIPQISGLRALQDLIYLKVRKAPRDAQIAFFSELRANSVCSNFCRELLTSLFVHSGRLGLEYDTSFFKREGHDLPIDKSVVAAVLRTSNLSESESELSSLVYLVKPKDGSAADFLNLLRILRSKFNIFGQNLADLPILNLAQKIDLFTQMEKLADSDLQTNFKSDLDLTISRLTQRLISSFISDIINPDSFNKSAEKIGRAHFPKLDEESILRLYKRRNMKNSSGYAVLNPYVVTILQTQKHLPTEVLKDIVRQFTSTARTELDQILKDYRPSRSQMLLLRSEFLAKLEPKYQDGGSSDIYPEGFYIPKFELPILSERLLKGQEWTDQIYERIASLWEYTAKGRLLEYICSAPTLPVSWQKNLINDIISGETRRMGRALRIISSQRHATPSLEQLFQSEIEKAEPSHLNKLFLVLYPLYGHESAGIKNVNFSRQM